MHPQQKQTYSQGGIDTQRATSALAPAPLLPAPVESVLNRKWTAEVIARGYTAVPDLLLSHMSQLGLTPTELVLLLQLLRYWWTAEHLPFPSKRKLAQAMGCSEKNVQKVMKGLEAKGFVVRVQRRKAAERSDSNVYCLDGLVDKLRALAAPSTPHSKQKDHEPVYITGEIPQADGPLARKSKFEQKLAQVRERLENW
jgi:hypothetical protein